MSLFGNTQTPAQQAATSVLKGTDALYSQLLNNYKALFNLVWNNKKASPEEVFAAIGTNAETICQCSALITGLLNEVKPGSVAFGPTQDITIHSDGSASLTPLPSSSSLSSASSESSDSSQSA